MNNGTREDRLLSISKFLPQQSSKLLSVISQQHTEGLGPGVLYLNKPPPNWNGDINRITDDGNTELIRNINTTDAGVNYRVKTATETIKGSLKLNLKVTSRHMYICIQPPIHPNPA